MTERRSIERTNGKAEAGGASRAPAVTSAVKILNFLALQKAEAGVSELARALLINKSTCFNILSALVQAQFLVKDDLRSTYRLGPRLVELGTASRRNFSRRATYRRILQALVEEAGIVCLVAQPLGDLSGVVVIDRLLPTRRRGEVVTAPVGHRYPITAPAMGRAVLSRLDDDEALEVLRTAPGSLPSAKVRELFDSLGRIREDGFATSLEEYEPGVNAVASCVMGRRGEVATVVCLIGAPTDLPAEALPAWGARLTAVARKLESDVAQGGAPRETP